MSSQSVSVAAFGHRAFAFAAVVALHIAALYAFYSGLLMRVVVNVPGIVHLIPTQQLIRTPPPAVRLSDPVFKSPTPFVSMPENPVIDTYSPNHIETVSSLPATPDDHARSPTHSYTAASFDPRHPFKVGEDYYPSGAVRLGEEGRCRVEVSIAADGRITTATLSHSTGFPLLDEACVTAVHGQRMLPAIQDGKPVESRAVVPIVWKLRSRP